MRNCRLLGLLDLDLGKEYVRGKVVSYLNQLINIGVAGFRVDAVKHMWPGDLQVIYDRINDLSYSAGFAPRTRPFIFNEVSRCTFVSRSSQVISYESNAPITAKNVDTLRCYVKIEHKVS